MGNRNFSKKGEMYNAGDGRKFEGVVRKSMASVFNIGATAYLKKLENDIAIRKIEMYPETFIAASVFYETRDIYETTRSGVAESNTDRKHSASEYGKWDFAFEDPGTTFRSEKRKLLVPNTTYVESCPICHGKGQKVCDTCLGTTTVPCEKCAGSGVVACNVCNGEGKIACEKCNGDGILITQIPVVDKDGNRRIEEKRNTCSECNGEGYFKCTKCDGAGTHPCKSCDGKGIGPCSSCQGTGSQKCINCSGVGNVIDEVEVSSDLVVKHNHVTLLKSALRDDMVPFFEEYDTSMEIHRVAEYTSQEPISAINTAEFNPSGRSLVYPTAPLFDTLLSEMKSVGNDAKLICYRVDVFQRIFLKVSYTFNENVYEMFLDLGTKQTHLTSNPYNDVMDKLASEIKRAYDTKHLDQVAIRLIDYRQLKKGVKGPLRVRVNPESIATSIVEHFLLFTLIGLAIPMVTVPILLSKMNVFTGSEARLLSTFAALFGVILSIGFYHFIKFTWTRLIQSLTPLTLRLVYRMLALLISAVSEFLLGYMVYLR